MPYQLIKLSDYSVMKKLYRLYNYYVQLYIDYTVTKEYSVQ